MVSLLALLTLLAPEGPNLDLPPSAVGELPPADEGESAQAIPVAEPDTRVVLRISEGLGPLTDRLALDLDLDEAEARRVRDGLLRSDLFILDPSARHRAVVRRTDRATVQVLLLDGTDTIGVSAIEWPAEESSRAPERPRSTLVIRERTPEAVAEADERFRGGFDPYFNPAGRLSWSRNGAFTQPSMPAAGSDWVILQDGQPIDDLDLALLLNDRALADRIENERESSRAWWRWGFGGAAVSSAGVGAAFLATADGRSSREVLGGSLLGVAVLCGALALLGDELQGGHVLSREEAQTLVRLYNDRAAEERKR